VRKGLASLREGLGELWPFLQPFFQLIGNPAAAAFSNLTLLPIPNVPKDIRK
jgi:hypothetical protein